MTVYEVRVEVRGDIIEPFVFYMQRKHLPEILATGCFQAIRFERADEGVFRSRYEAATRADLERYLKDHAPHFRADFIAHCPEGCTVSRAVWDEMGAFTR